VHKLANGSCYTGNVTAGSAEHQSSAAPAVAKHCMIEKAPVLTTTVLGLPVHQVGLEAALAQITSWIEEGHARRPGESPAALHHIITLNPEIVMAAKRDPLLAATILRADLTTADGVGVTWAARLNGRRLTRVTGIDLLEQSAQLAAERGYRLFLLGAAPGVAAEAAARLTERYPALQPPGTFSGSPAAGAETAILARLRQSRPDMLFVAFGSPAQEHWITHMRDELGQAGVGVAVGVGGAFDFISGRAKRAPGWMRKVGLEWAYRLSREPWRWRRMLALPRFVLAVMLSLLRTKTVRRQTNLE
jgi:N-acetylglucosaminyldiphosphoundecaprenol N-acetyl-beta-D-mannosaminyltransferase